MLTASQIITHQSSDSQIWHVMVYKEITPKPVSNYKQFQDYQALIYPCSLYLLALSHSFPTCDSLEPSHQLHQPKQLCNLYVTGLTQKIPLLRDVKITDSTDAVLNVLHPYCFKQHMQRAVCKDSKLGVWVGSFKWQKLILHETYWFSMKRYMKKFHGLASTSNHD